MTAKDIKPGRPIGVRGHNDEGIEFFTIAEIAELLRVSSRTVRRWVRARDLIAHKIGGAIRIAEGDLRAFLALRRDY